MLSLRMDSIAGVGPGGFELSLDGATFQYGGPTNSAGGLGLGAGGATLEIINAGTTMTLTGPITGTPTSALTKTGPGTLALGTGVATFNGLTIAAGTVQTADDTALGTGPVTLNALSTLQYTTTTAASRTFNLVLGTLVVDRGATVSVNGSAVNGGFVLGGGTLAIGGGTALTAVTTVTSVTIEQTGPATATNVTNGGAFIVDAGQMLAWNVGTNTSGGRLTVNGTANVNDFVSDGQINIPSGGVLANSAAALVLGGGSRTYVGSAASPGGMLDLGGQTLELNGGLLVNNGAVSGTVNVNYGSLTKGAGHYDVINIGDGGTFAPGNSPGVATAGSMNFDDGAAASGGPELSIELAGTEPGTEYDQLHVTGQLSLGGKLAVSLINNFTPVAGQSFDILDWGTLTGTFGSLVLPALNTELSWNTSQLYTTGVLSVQSAGLPGDYNRNSIVDAATIPCGATRSGRRPISQPTVTPMASLTSAITRFGHHASAITAAVARVQVRMPPCPNRRRCGCSSPES